MKTCYAYPQWEFEEICKNNHWNDSNVEDLDDWAFISILDYDDTNHYFKHPHRNVLNIEFADVGAVGYKHITQEQVEQIRAFIEAHKGKNFMVHCVAGQSRSQAVSLYISRWYEGYENIDESKYSKNHIITPNWYIVSELEKSKRESELDEAFNNFGRE